MKNKNRQVSNIILAFGSLLMFIGFTTFLLAISVENQIAEYIMTALVLFAGICFMYLYVAFFRKTFHFVSGLSLILSGILFMLIKTHLIPWTMEEAWPLTMLFISISIFIIGKINNTRINFAYGFSAVFLLISSLVFSLFSFDVISFSFSQIVKFFVPVFMILGGAFLIILFIHRQKINDILKSSDEDLIDDGDIENF